MLMHRVQKPVAFAHGAFFIIKYIVRSGAIIAPERVLRRCAPREHFPYRYQYLSVGVMTSPVITRPASVTILSTKDRVT